MSTQRHYQFASAHAPFLLEITTVVTRTLKAHDSLGHRRSLSSPASTYIPESRTAAPDDWVTHANNA
ncbi:hypothetical protein NMY22_g9973 [Coprinellus aureogranulatus]|nr:hypothetical protein NMY22_g9973 [Coprinellus aureogranulatus]